MAGVQRSGIDRCVRALFTETEMLSFEEIEGCFPDGAVSLPDGWTGVTAQWLHDFAHAVAVAEREACANVCEEKASKYYDHAKPPYMDCASAIRARSNA